MTSMILAAEALIWMCQPSAFHAGRTAAASSPAWSLRPWARLKRIAAGAHGVHALELRVRHRGR